jgi:L-glyceraldehyde reductase
VAGKPKLTDHVVVQEIAKKLDATAAQVLIAWGAQRGYSVIPKSIQEERIISNFKQIKLSDEDFKQLSAIGHGNHTRFVSHSYCSCCRDAEFNCRFNLPFQYSTPWDVNIFDEPAEKASTFKVKIQ